MSHQILKYPDLYSTDVLSSFLKEIRIIFKEISFERVSFEGNFDDVMKDFKQDKFDIFFLPLNYLTEDIEENYDYIRLIPHHFYMICKPHNKSFNQLKSFFVPPVAFIGSGPGTPEWLTIQGKKLIDVADICFYDALVHPQIIAELPDRTQKYFVGKRGDSPSFDQSKINRIISQAARKGQKVVRLKGGDSGIFGRINEEIQELQDYGVSYTITPGISAMQGLASRAEIFLTQRGVSDRVTVTTARKAGGSLTELANFDESTLVLYMGILNIEQIVAQLIEAGYANSTPVALAVNISRPGEQIVYGQLENITQVCQEEGLRPPGLIIVGNTAKARTSVKDIISPSSIFAKSFGFINAKEHKYLIEKLRVWGAEPVSLYSSYQDSLLTRYYQDCDAIILASPEEALSFYETISQFSSYSLQTLIALNPATAETVEVLLRTEAVLIDEKSHDCLISSLKVYFQSQQS